MVSSLQTYFSLLAQIQMVYVMLRSVFFARVSTVSLCFWFSVDFYLYNQSQSSICNVLFYPLYFNKKMFA